MDFHGPWRHRGRWPFPRPRSAAGVAGIVAAVVVVGYAVVGMVAGVPGVGHGERVFPGQGFVWLAAVAIVGLASLVDALRPGKSRRRSDHHTNDDPHRLQS